MLTLSQEAALLVEGLHGRFVTSAEVAGWADRHIARLDTPPNSLIEASLAARDRPENVAELLGPLALGVDLRPIGPSRLALMYHTLVRTPTRVGPIAASLLAWSLEPTAPALVRELGTTYYEIEDADACGYGDRAEIAADLLRSLEPYAGAPTVAI
jgi:hypothetical protein